MDEQTQTVTNRKGEILGVSVKLNHEVNDNFRDFLMCLRYGRRRSLVSLAWRHAAVAFG